MSTQRTVKVDIWSDVFCPYCYIGKRRLFRVAQEQGYTLEVTWHSFELNPNAPETDSESLVSLISKKYGLTLEQSTQAQQNLAKLAASEGIDFQWQKTRRGNSFNAHRLIHFAATKGLANETKEQLFQAYMTDGKLISDKAVLKDIAVSVGLDREETRQVLESDQFAEQVRIDELEARHLQITGVPFFVFNQRLGVSGAQPDSVFKNTLLQAFLEYPIAQAETSSNVCGADDYCALPEGTKPL